MCDHADRTAAMVVICRDTAGTPTVWCDPCIAPIVAALNAGGVATVWSCCGHGRRPGVIGLSDGRQIVIACSLDEVEAMTDLLPDINGEVRRG